MKKDSGQQPLRHTYIDSSPDEYIAIISDAVSSGLLCARCDEEYSIYYINDFLLELMGYTREELFAVCDGYFDRIIHPDDREREHREIDSALSTADRYQITYRVFAKDGSILWIRESGRKLVFKTGEELLFCFGADITEQVSMKHDLREIMDELPAGFVVHELVGGKLQLEMISQGFCYLAGRSRAELLEAYRSNPVWGIHPDDVDAVMNAVKEGLASGVGYDCIYRMLGFSDEYFWVRSTSRIVTNEDGTTRVYAVLSDISQIKAAEQELLYRNELADLLLAGEDSVTYDLEMATQDMNITYVDASGRRVNRIIKNFLGHTPDPLVLHPDHHATINDALREAIAAPATGAFEYRGNHDGKGYQWYRAVYKSLADASGRVYRIIGKANNVQAEKELRQRFDAELARRFALESNLLDSTCFDYTDDRVIDFEHNQPIVSSRGTELDLRTMIDIMATRVPDKAQRDEFVRHFARENVLAQYAAGRRQFVLEYQFEIDGRATWVRSETNLIEQPGSGHIIALIYSQDINEQKRLELLMRSVMTSEFDLVAQIDTRDGSAVLYAEDPVTHAIIAEQLEDYDGGRAAYINRFVVPEDQAAALAEVKIPHIVERLEAEGDYSYYYRTREPDGSVARKKIHMLYSDRAAGIVSLIRTDVTEASAEEQRRNSLLSSALAIAEQANTAKSRFLTNISHDIRTPMNAIIGMSRVAAAHLDEPERVLDCLEKITVSSQHLLSLINDVLDMSRIESGKMILNKEAISLPEFFQGLITIVQPQIKAANLQLFVDTIDVTDEQVIGDKLRITQMFLNIMGNACKFTEPGGSITIRILQLPQRIKGHGTYQFTFTDTGIGMSPEFVKHIFEPFEREFSPTVNKREGSGLGMAITKQIVDLMSGEIFVDSELDRGTTFTVTLPLALPEDAVTVPEITELRGLRALVVDDDASVCTSVSRMLRDIGMRTDWTTSGREALAHAREARDEGDPYHTLIIDWQMPDLNGVETARQMHKIVGAEVPIIILSAYDWSDIGAEAHEAGVAVFLPKPLFRSDLYRTLRQVNRLDPQELTPELPQRFYSPDKRILLVEDNELNMEIVAEIVSGVGITIEMAWDGNEAVEKMRAADEGYFDLILCDIQMPGMNGHEATRAIRALPRTDVKTLPILALTADAFKEDVEKALAAGMNGHIAKPIDPDELLNIISRYL